MTTHTETPLRAGGEPAGTPDALVTLARALQDAATTPGSVDAQAERLRGLLERGPLQLGCDPVHDDIVVERARPLDADPLAETLAHAGDDARQLLARLDTVDAEAEAVLAALRRAVAVGTIDGAEPGGETSLAPEATAAATAAPRTFRAGMSGKDIRAWQLHLNRRLRDWGLRHELDADGDFGDETTLWSRRVLFGLGMSIADFDGVTPEHRIKARHPEARTAEELSEAARRRGWLRRLRRRVNAGGVHPPVEHIITSAHGFKPGHDGIDLICPREARIFAPCRARVIDVRAGGWWGKGPTGDVSKGDGIIQLEALDNIGPLAKGMHIGYGHAEQAQVVLGQIVSPGDVIGRAGLANAWHIHFMLNRGDTMRGIGTLDPRPCLDLFTAAVPAPGP